AASARVRGGGGTGAEEGPGGPARAVPRLLARAGTQQLRHLRAGRGRVGLGGRAHGVRVGHRRARLARSL
ncbi:MAG: hypothetical protein AVDCRST_MAG36-2236, partial [uncultured Nocardioidaceae bacterium]